MKCLTCKKKEATLKRLGAYCSKKCREKALKRLDRQKKKSQKRREESEVRKFEEYLKSGRRTY